MAKEEVKQMAHEAYKRHISNGGFGSKFDFINGYMACANEHNQWHKVEDERIRKELIRAFKSFNSIKVWNGIERTNILAWLEKQGEHKSIWHNEDEEPQRGSLILLIMQSGTPVVAKIIEPNHTFNHGERWAYIDDLLEKQSEQKPQGKSALEAINEEEVDNANKVEPKFNLYDWVVTDKGDTVQIGAVNDGHYTLFNGMDFNMSYADKCWHKWTIKDAKDGDVLYSHEHNLLWIYKDKDTYHVATNLNYTHNISIGGDIAIPSDVCPATKEQRDLLFQKMKEEGYEWNKDKKKLIKL